MHREKEEEREETQERVRDRETETERDVRETKWGDTAKMRAVFFFWVVAVSFAARKREWERHEEGNDNKRALW